MQDFGPATRPTFSFTFHPSASPFTATQQEYLANHRDARYKYIATGALVFNNTDPATPRILLLQRSAGDSMPNRWEVPGGACDDEDESILYAVARELWEEAGLKAAYISAPVGDLHLFTSRSGKQICKFHFVVQVEGDADRWLEPKLDPKEHQQFLWASETEVRSRKAKDTDLNFTTDMQEDIILQTFDRLAKK